MAENLGLQTQLEMALKALAGAPTSSGLAPDPGVAITTSPVPDGVVMPGGSFNTAQGTAASTLIIIFDFSDRLTRFLKWFSALYATPHVACAVRCL